MTKTTLQLWAENAPRPEFDPEGLRRGTKIAVRFPEWCIHCGSLVFADDQGSWVDRTGGDGCDNPTDVHQAVVGAGEDNAPERIITDADAVNTDFNPHPNWPIEAGCCSHHFPGNNAEALRAEGWAIDLIDVADVTNYTVSVSNTFDAASPEDAVAQMAAWLVDYAYRAGYRVTTERQESFFIDAERVL